MELDWLFIIVLWVELMMIALGPIIELVVSLHANMMDVLSNFLPTMIIVSSIYMNKKSLQRHLCWFVMNNTFSIKFEPRRRVFHTLSVWTTITNGPSAP